MRVLRYFHAARDPAHRQRDEALVRAGVDVTLVVPRSWPEPGEVRETSFEVVELDVRRAGDVNRHVFSSPAAFAKVVDRVRPDVVDLLEEPFSAVTHQLLGLLPPTMPVVHYTAQNLDKRFPPPFSWWERRALARIDGLYPCSRQAASVAVGKGFRGPVRVLPLGVEPTITAGRQDLPADVLQLLLVGRLVPHKGIVDAVEALATVRRSRPAFLTIVGSGPEEATARSRAADLGVADALQVLPWTDVAGLAEHYGRAHVLLAPSRATRTWVEQFGRMVAEAQAAGAVVVGYASGSLPEVVGDAGVLVPERDVAALGSAVLALAGDPSRWRSLRERGVAASTSRTWDAIAAGQVELYDDALTGGSGRRTVRPGRAAARAAYGEPARVPGSERPFALPVLREDNPLTRALEKAADRLHREPGVEPDPLDLRVVHLDHTATLSGGEIALERLVASRSSRHPHVILAEDGPLRARLEAVGASVEVLPLSLRARSVGRTDAAGQGGARVAVDIAVHVVRLTRRLRQLRPDVVHTNSLKSGYYGSLAARLARTPVVWHVRDRIADDYLPGRAVTLTRGLLRRVPDVVVANSRETARTTGVRARVVADPYLPARKPTTPPSDGPSYSLAVVGRLATWKGQDVVLRAVSDVPEVSVRVVGAALFGEDAHAEALRSLAVELGIDDRVVFVGFVDDVEAELARVDVVVHSSVIPEPFGQVVVEGMAAGRPVVATDAGGPAEVITPGVDGLLTAPGDVAALVAALRELTDPTLRRRLGAAAAVRARDFEPGPVGAAMTAVWLAAASSRPARTDAQQALPTVDELSPGSTPGVTDTSASPV